MGDGNGGGDRLAKERTDLAQERTLLANERTFSAWVRTGLAAVVGGLAVARLFGPPGELWIAQVVGVILILTGAGFYAAAYRSYCERCQVAGRGAVRLIPEWFLHVLVIALLVSTAFALYLAIV